MLPKDIRLDLRQRRGFFQEAHVLRSPHLTVFWKEIESPLLRAAVVIKKRSGKAVERSKFRRVLRSALTELWKMDNHLFQPPVGVVVIPRGPLQSLLQYKKELKELFAQIQQA